MFGKIFKAVGSVIDEVGAEIKRGLSADEMKRAAAVCAMMAYLPDNNADDDEIEASVDAIKHRLGSTFSVREIVAEVKECVDAMKTSRRFGKLDMMDKLSPAVGTSEAEFLVQVAAAVGEAPDDSLPKGSDPFTAAERALAREIAKALGVDPKTAGI